MRGRSVSKATVEEVVVPLLVSGLVNSTGLGCCARSLATLGIDPGQSRWYEFPSQSPSLKKHPSIRTRLESDFGTQKLKSSSGSRPPASCFPGFAQLYSAVIFTQFSKWPISSEKATLYVWADHVMPLGFAVSYSW